MANTDTPTGGERRLSGEVLLYRQPEPLSSSTHGNLGIKRDGPHLEFLKNAHYVPLMASEFTSACGFYPIVFGGDAEMPLAVMGLKEGQNVFVREDGTFEPHSYAPGYIRRYPFVLANRQGSQEAVVCIDRAHEAIGENPDVPFFENGQASNYTQQAINFLQNFEQHRVGTEQLVKDLRELDLLEDKTSSYTPAPDANGAQKPQVPVAQFRGISEEKLRALPAEKLKDMHDKGLLPLIYAHLFSLNNWTYLVNRSAERGYLPGGAAVQQPADTSTAPEGGSVDVQ